MRSDERFGCCGFHLQCQLTGKCLDETPERCSLYTRTLSTNFPLLYALKSHGIVGIATNHLTPKGKHYTVDTYVKGLSDAALTSLVLLVLGQLTNGGVDVREVKRAVQGIKKDIKELNCS